MFPVHLPRARREISQQSLAQGSRRVIIVARAEPDVVFRSRATRTVFVSSKRRGPVLAAERVNISPSTEIPLMEDDP